jgi:hypothetical protein
MGTDLQLTGKPAPAPTVDKAIEKRFFIDRWRFKPGYRLGIDYNVASGTAAISAAFGI